MQPRARGQYNAKADWPSLDCFFFFFQPRLCWFLTHLNAIDRELDDESLGSSSSIKKGFLMFQSKTIISRFQVLTDRINYENIINLSFSMFASPIYLTNFIICIICLQFRCFHPNFSQIS